MTDKAPPAVLKKDRSFRVVPRPAEEDEHTKGLMHARLLREKKERERLKVLAMKKAAGGARKGGKIHKRIKRRKPQMHTGTMKPTKEGGKVEVVAKKPRIHRRPSQVAEDDKAARQQALDARKAESARQAAQTKLKLEKLKKRMAAKQKAPQARLKWVAIQELKAYAGYMNGVIAYDLQQQSDAYKVSLDEFGLFPLKTNDGKCLDQLRNGIVFARYINAIHPNTIDERTLFVKGLTFEKTIPIPAQRNAKLVLSACKSLGITVNGVTIQHVCNPWPEKNVNTTLDLLWGMVQERVFRNVSLHKSPDLHMLTHLVEAPDESDVPVKSRKGGAPSVFQHTVSEEELARMPPADILMRWSHFFLKQTGDHRQQILFKDSSVYNTLLDCFDAPEVKVAPAPAGQEAELARNLRFATAMMQRVKLLGVHSYITDQDVAIGNSRLNLLFLSSLYGYAQRNKITAPLERTPAPEPEPEPEPEPVVEEPAAVVEEPAAAVEEPATEPVAESAAAVEEPAVEEPAAAVEEPAVEEPAVEEPAVEEPAVEEPAAAVEESAVEEPAAEEPAAEEPAVEEPEAEVEEPADTEEEIKQFGEEAAGAAALARADVAEAEVSATSAAADAAEAATHAESHADAAPFAAVAAAAAKDAGDAKDAASDAASAAETAAATTAEAKTVDEAILHADEAADAAATANKAAAAAFEAAEAAIAAKEQAAAAAIAGAAADAAAADETTAAAAAEREAAAAAAAAAAAEAAALEAAQIAEENAAVLAAEREAEELAAQLAEMESELIRSSVVEEESKEADDAAVADAAAAVAAAAAAEVEAVDAAEAAEAATSETVATSDQASETKNPLHGERANDEDAEARVFRMWINSLDMEGVNVQNLFSDLGDGLVLIHVIDNLSKMNGGESVVKWKQVELNTSSRFKKVSNGNVVVECSKKLGLSMVNVGGTDIVDGDEKLILGICYRLMKLHIKQFLDHLQKQLKENAAELGLGHLDTTSVDSTVVSWANGRLKNASASIDATVPEDLRRTTTSGLRDKSLGDCCFWLNLITAFEPDVVKWDLVSKDDTEEARLLNARYCISLAMMLGGTVFLTDYDIIDAKPRMNLIFLASLMAIDLASFQEAEENNDL